MEGKIDMAIVSSTEEHAMINYFPLISDEMVVLLSKENPLSKLNNIGLENLKEENLILYDIPEEKTLF